MSIATEILSLRRDQSSSVETLIGLLEWQRSARDKVFAEMRSYSVAQAADLVLMNVAVHALEAQDSVPPAREMRRAVRSIWSRLRRSDTPKLSQRKRRFA
jgi:hypothetical protein